MVEATPFLRGLRRLGGGVKTSLAVVGFASAAGFYMEYRKHQEVETEPAGDKKKVLFIPFNRLELVEQKDKDFSSKFRDMTDRNDRPLRMEVSELVDVIHHASKDPNIVALYGQFGHGSILSSAGWADLEEVRNALKVFRESHRRHSDPNLLHQERVIPKVECKPLYAYADTFQSLGDPANKEYYLASICTHIHMQKNGELNLLGMLSQNFFLRSLLERNGVGLHVFKHGQYKNAPNMFTETRFNREHYENVKNIVDAVDQSIAQEISRSRSTALLTSWLKLGKLDDQNLWKKVHEAGPFPADAAWKAGLVDYLPRRSPLDDLVRKNNSDTPEAQQEWEIQETDFKAFRADSVINIDEYARTVRKLRKRSKYENFLDQFSNNSSGLGKVFVQAGLASDDNDTESSGGKGNIALLRVNGNIMDSTANKVVRSIRKIGKDSQCKAVVLRVSSPGGSITACETISQELRALQVPVVVSFGNVSASGGYYISSYADRIFASQKTLTGSIGVFGVRLDLTGLASKYGVNVEHVTSGDLAASLDPFHPMTRRMKENFSGSIDRYYKQFKSIVSEGRGMPLGEVEEVAQGRVWTGEQSKWNGLVDEIGGLQRAIAYATRTHAGGEDVIVKEWPEDESVWERLVAIRNENDAREFLAFCRDSVFGGEDKSSIAGQDAVDWLLNSPRGLPSNFGGVLLAADENAAVQMLLENAKTQQASLPMLPPKFWD